MDPELKAYLEAMESRLRENVEGVESRLREHTETVEMRLREHTENVETRLLSEFWKWARSSDLKSRQHTGSIASMDERLLAVEERLSELERRRHN